MNSKSPKTSPTVVLSKKDIIDEDTVKSLLKYENLEHEVVINKFDSRNLISSTPVSNKNAAKTRISLRGATKKSSETGSKAGKKSRRAIQNDVDNNLILQSISEGAMEVSLNWKQDLPERSDLNMDSTLASLIGQEMLNPSDSFLSNDFDLVADGKPRKKARKNPTPKRKKSKTNQECVVGDDEDADSVKADIIKNIKTPICIPKKRRIDDEEKTFNDFDSGITRRTSRSAAIRARQKVKHLGMEEDHAQLNLSLQDDDDNDDEYVDDDASKIEEDDEEFDDISIEEDDDSVVTRREFSRLSSGREALKKKKWADSIDKDVVLNLKLKQQKLALLPNLMPRKEFFKSLTHEEGMQFLPCNQNIKFRVQRRAHIPPQEDSIELDLFGCHPTEDSFTLKIGGPLWSMDWCPTPIGKSCNQYLALYTHQSAAQTFPAIIPPTYQKTCLMQIWDFGKLTNKMSAILPNLLPLLVINGGPIWQMKWAPGASTWICESGVEDDASSDSNVDDTFKSRIGLLACACHSGNVKIFSIPQFARKRYSVEDQKNYQQSLSFFEVLPALTLKTTGSACIPCICVDWNISEKHLIVAAGFADGAVAFWNLNAQSTLLSGIKNEDMDHTRVAMYPYKTFKAHLSVVSGLHFCPTNANLLLTCSHDKFMKVWNINETNRCVLSNRTYKITASAWPAIERSRFYAGFDEAYILHRNSVACYNFYESKVVHISHCLHNGTINSISHREWSSVITGCDNTGCVQSCLSIPEKIKGIFTHRKVISIMQVENDVNLQAGCNCKSYHQPQDQDVGNFPISCCCNKSFIIKDFNKGWQFKNFIKSQTELPFDDIIKNPFSALHRVSWNTNRDSCDWIAFGGMNGLLRVRLVPDLLSQKK